MNRRRAMHLGKHFGNNFGLGQFNIDVGGTASIQPSATAVSTDVARSAGYVSQTIESQAPSLLSAQQAQYIGMAPSMYLTDSGRVAASGAAPSPAPGSVEEVLAHEARAGRDVLDTGTTEVMTRADAERAATGAPSVDPIPSNGAVPNGGLVTQPPPPEPGNGWPWWAWALIIGGGGFALWMVLRR